jgi:hypothetical protein
VLGAIFEFCSKVRATLVKRRLFSWAGRPCRCPTARSVRVHVRPPAWHGDCVAVGGHELPNFVDLAL